MALRVSYKDRIGYYTKTEKWPDERDKKVTIVKSQKSK